MIDFSQSTGLLGALALAITMPACTAAGETQSDDSASAEAEVPLSEQPGPRVGDPAPVSQSVMNTDGTPTSIADLAGPRGTVLVFVRSVEWCPFCQRQLTSLKDVAADLESRGYTLAALSYDSPQTQSEFMAAQDIPFIMVSDEPSSAIDAFGVRDPQYTEGRALGVPYASIFVLNPDGTVAAKSVSSDYRIRPTNEEVLRLIDA